jgi:mannosyltransferase
MDRLERDGTSHHPARDVAPPRGKLLDGASARTMLVPIAVAIFAVAVILRVFHLDYLSLWNDETFSRYYYDLFGPKYMLTEGRLLEPTPPLYYFVLEAWSRLFGHSAVGMRSLSVVASLVALPLVYAVAREVSSRTVALVSAALFAVSPMAVFYSQEARVYMLTVSMAAIMLLGIARYLRDPRTANLLLYGGGAMLGLYSHATMAFMVAACNLVVLAYLLLTPSAERGAAIRGWLVANVIVAILAIPLFGPMLAIGTHGAGLAWIPPLKLRDILVSMTALVAGVAIPARMPGAELTALLLLVVGAAIMLAGMPRRAFAVTVGIPIVFVVLLVIASLKQPILLPRVLCWMTLPLCVTIASAIVTPSRARWSARIIVFLTFSAGLYYQLFLVDGVKPPYREVFHDARPDFLKADEVIIAPYMSALPLRYYAPGLTNLRKWRDPSVTEFEAKELPEKLHIPYVTVQQVNDDIRRGKAVWVVAGSPDAPFLPQLLSNVSAPERQYSSLCNATAHGGVEPIPCVAAYGWNVDPHATK